MQYYFIDKDIYFQNKKQPPRKVELFNVIKDESKDEFSGYDIDGNFYELSLNRLIEE